jgi:guanyl-specific ribonuclease Sa
MSLEAAEREYLKYLQNKMKQSKQAAAAEALAAAAQAVAVAAPPTTPVGEEPVSKKRGRKPKATQDDDAEARRLFIESIRP